MELGRVFRAIGLMTGSSMDGIDAAILDTDGIAVNRHVEGVTINYSTSFHLLLRASEYAVQQELGNIKAAERNFNNHVLQYVRDKEIDLFTLYDELEGTTFAAVVKKLTMLHYQAVTDVLAKANMNPKDIDVIGFHGQNLYHNPPKKITLQVGDGQLLASLSGITVVNNFRTNDVKHGGQGAPFAPLYHQALAVKGDVYPVAVVNCGGIANISIITGPDEKQVMGFDVGPGSVLIDRYVRIKTLNKEFMDEGGKYGLLGKANLDTLKSLKESSVINYEGDFFHKLPPKSLDASNFILVDQLDKLSMEDACATLEVFTAQCICKSIDLLTISPKLWVLAGGGWNNPVIIQSLRKLLHDKSGDVKVCMADDLGWSNKYLEAGIFAFMAVRSLNNLPISFPNITGVPRALPGGNLYNPQV